MMSKKILSAISFEGRLDNAIQTILESRRMKSAIIKMHRGTVIPAHHVRVVNKPDGGKLAVAGINPGIFEEVRKGFPTSITAGMRDFFGPGEWDADPLLVARGIQDETGWSEPGEGERYNASRSYIRTRKFGKVLTINVENIEEIKWIDEGQLAAAAERFPYVRRPFGGPPVEIPRLPHRID
jgi:hypothetical protein